MRADAVERNGKFSRRLSIALASIGLLTAASCTLTATRPVQDMSDTNAAIRAAKEVQADTLAPELYREATEWWFKARHEYKFKNFYFARKYAIKARRFAEQAEFQSIKNGGQRTDIAPPDQPNPAPAATPYDYPAPQGTPADVYEKRKAADEARKEAEMKASQQQQATPTQTPAVLAPPPIIVPGSTPPGTTTTGGTGGSIPGTVPATAP